MKVQFAIKTLNSDSLLKKGNLVNTIWSGEHTSAYMTINRETICCFCLTLVVLVALEVVVGDVLDSSTHKLHISSGSTHP